jgi:hypothetical protein
MSERKAVTKKLALEYRRSDKTGKGELLNQALTLKVVKLRPPRRPIYVAAVITALQFVWAVPGIPCGRLLAAALPGLVPRPCAQAAPVGTAEDRQ